MKRGYIQKSHITPSLFDEAWEIIGQQYVGRFKYSSRAWKKIRAKWLRRRYQGPTADHDRIRGLLQWLDPNQDCMSPKRHAEFHRDVFGLDQVSVSFEGPEDAGYFVPGYEHVKITDITGKTRFELESALRSRNNVTGLVLSFCGNSGGQINGAVDVAALFLKPGTTVARLSFG